MNQGRRGRPSGERRTRSLRMSSALTRARTSGGTRPALRPGPRLRVALGAPLRGPPTAFSSGAKLRCGGTSSFGGATVGRRGSFVAAKTPSSIWRLRSAISLLLAARAASSAPSRTPAPCRRGRRTRTAAASASARRRTAVPDRLRERPAVDEVGVGEVRVPVEVVVDRVVDAAVVLAAEAEVQRWRCRGAGGTPCSRSPSRARRCAGRPARGSPCGPPRTRRRRGAAPARASRRETFVSGILDVARHLVDEVLERVRAGHRRGSRGRCRRC